jgi:hypothetical protein
MTARRPSKDLRRIWPVVLTVVLFAAALLFLMTKAIRTPASDMSFVEGGDQAVSGTLTVLDPKAFDDKIPEGTFAAVWEQVDGTLANDRFVLVDQDANEVYEGSFVDLNGALVDVPDDPRFQVLTPSVMVAMDEGSPVFVWAFGGREGHIP